LINLTSVLVMLKIPKLLVRFIAVYLLGKLSVVYWQLLCEERSVSTYCAGWVARMVERATPLSLLTDNGSSQPMIHTKFCEERLSAAISKGHLTGLELKKIVQFALRQIDRCNPNFTFMSSSLSAMLRRSDCYDELHRQLKVQRVPLHKFFAMSSSNETVSLDAFFGPTPQPSHTRCP